LDRKRKSIESGKKNLHAFVRGELIDSCEEFNECNSGSLIKVVYCPFDERGFYDKVSGVELWSAKYCQFNQDGLNIII